MKLKNILTILLLAIILVSCTPASTPVPTSTATNTPLPEATVTFTPEPTSTPVNFIEGLNHIPEPDDDFINQVVNENYLKVMGLSRDQVNLIYAEHTGMDGQTFIVMLDSTTGVPLAVYTDQWKKSTLNFFSEQLGMPFGTDNLGPNDPLVPGFEEQLNNYSRFVSGNYWSDREPERGEYSNGPFYSEYMLNEAKKRGMKDLYFHVALHNGSYPQWLKEGNFTKDELREIMRERITDALINSPEATFLEVVNEPYNAEEERARDPFYEAWDGYDYIVEAFQIARETADEMGRPEVKLIFNDTGNHIPGYVPTRVTKEIVEMLLEENLIDYVGMQMHLNQWGGITNGKLDQRVIKEIEYYKDKVPVLITELTYEPTEQELAMSPGDFDKRLSQIFTQVVQMAIDSDNVGGITTWGYNEKYLQDINWYQLFDKEGNPRLAYYEVLRVLFEATKK